MSWYSHVIYFQLKLKVFLPTSQLSNNSYQLFNFYYFSSAKKMVLLLFFVFFFSSSGMHRSHHLAGCHAFGNNSLLFYFLHALSCLYLLHQVISLTWIIVTGSWKSKLSSSSLIFFLIRKPFFAWASIFLT